jgi:triosephosphate isomerase
LLDRVGQRLAGSPILLGAQDCHAEQTGAFTGDVSAAMLKDLGCSHVIVGHSERRALHGETDQLVHAKALAALHSDLVPIICVGETLAERESGRATEIVQAQIAGSVPDGILPAKLVIAYEPVWAIGSGQTATPDDIAAMHRMIRAALAAKTEEPDAGLILYGGSVKPDNAAAILALDGVDGALIGGASLKAGDFMAIADTV